MKTLLLPFPLILLVFAAFTVAAVFTGCKGQKKPTAEVSAQIAALKGADASKKADALVALAQAGPDAAPAVAELTQILKDSDPVTRRLAAYALGQIGKPAASAIPDLRALLADSDHSVVITVYHALVSIDPKSVTPADQPKNVTMP